MVPNQPAMHCACFWFNCLWICSRMFKAQVNFIFCIPHIDHGSLLLKSQKKNVLAHGRCWWKFCLATVHCPEQNANKWRLNLGNFQQLIFFFVALSDFTILKCGPNLLKHQPSLSLPPWSSRRRLSLPPWSSRRRLSLPPLSSSRSLIFLGPADAASVFLLCPAAVASVSSVQQP